MVGSLTDFQDLKRQMPAQGTQYGVPKADIDSARQELMDATARIQTRLQGNTGMENMPWAQYAILGNQDPWHNSTNDLLNAAAKMDAGRQERLLDADKIGLQGLQMKNQFLQQDQENYLSQSNNDFTKQLQMAKMINEQNKNRLRPMGSVDPKYGVSGNKLPVSVRNNNPGNIRDTKTGSFRQFETPQEGLDAMKQDLLVKVSGKSPAMTAKFGEGYAPTLSNLIATWAPPSENDTGKYVETVAKASGLTPDTVITAENIDQVIPHMIKHEGGSSAADYYSGLLSGRKMADQQIQPIESPVVSVASGGPMASIDQQIIPIESPVEVASSLPTVGEEDQSFALETPGQPESTFLVDNDGRPYTKGASKGQQFVGYTNPETGELVITGQRPIPSEGSQANVKGEGDLRKEFNGITKDFRALNEAHSRILKSSTDPSAAGDVALVYNYMKMLDPGSTVMSGEYATAANAAGVPDRIRAKLNAVIDGQKLAPAQRADFVNRAGMLFNGATDNYNQQVNQYRSLAEQYSYNPDRIAKPYEVSKKSEKEIPLPANDPFVEQAKSSGYSDKEIREFLSKRAKNGQ